MLDSLCRRIAFAGHSAGAHLVGMLVSSPWFSQIEEEERSRVVSVFHLGGVFELKALLATTIVDPLKMDVEEAEANSPASAENLNRARKNSAKLKTYIFSGEYEAPGIAEQCKNYRAVGFC